MKIKLSKEKANNIRIAYCAFWGLYIIAFIFKLFELKIFGVLASSVSWGAYTTLFLCGIKVFRSNRPLLISNICFIILNITTVLCAFSDGTGVVELYFALATILLFLIISNKTLGILEEKYKDKQIEESPY